MDELDWREYRRDLPHLRQKGATYFVTWRIWSTQTDLTPAERTETLRSLLHFHKKRYYLLAYVVMNDHVHVIVKPYDGWRLEDVIQAWKSFTGHAFQRQYRRGKSTWQDEYMDRIVRDRAELEEKTQYILNNPRKRWPDLEGDYPWVGMNPPEEME